MTISTFPSPFFLAYYQKHIMMPYCVVHNIRNGEEEIKFEKQKINLKLNKSISYYLSEANMFIIDETKKVSR